MHLQSLLHIGNISLQTGVLYFYMWNGLIWYVVSKYSNVGSYYLNCVYENALVSIAQEGLGRHRKLACCVPHVDCPLKDSPQYFLDIKLHFFYSKCICKCCLWYVGHFVLVTLCQTGQHCIWSWYWQPTVFFLYRVSIFFSRKCICKCCLWYLDHFVLVTMCQTVQHSVLPWCWVRSIITFFVSLFSGVAIF